MISVVISDLFTNLDGKERHSDAHNQREELCHMLRHKNVGGATGRVQGSPVTKCMNAQNVYYYKLMSRTFFLQKQ